MARYAPVSVPRVTAQVNGAIVNSIMQVDISLFGSYKSSRFEMTVSTNGDTSDNQWLSLLGGRVVVEICIQTQQPEGDVSMFEGLADSVAIDPINHTARIMGRDYSSILISSAYQNAFCNQTASEIANYVATRHGLDSNITATTNMIGSYQCDGYNQVLLNAHARATNEWDLLTQLARNESFELFIDGSTLVFAPMTSLPNNNTSITISNVISMKLVRNCPLSDLTTLTVKSWNSWQGQAFSYTDDQSSGQPAISVSGLPADPGTEIAIVRPNLTSQDTERIANQHLEALSRQEKMVHIVMPGETMLKPRDILCVSGTGSDFDANYFVNSVRRSLSSTAGFIEYVEGALVGQNSLFPNAASVTSNG